MINTDACQIKARLQEAARLGTPERIQSELGTDKMRGIRGSVIGCFNRAMDSLYRYFVWTWLFDGDHVLHSRDLSDSQVLALFSWINFYQDDDGWHTSDEFAAELPLVLSAALEDIDHPGLLREALRLGGVLKLMEQRRVASNRLRKVASDEL